MEFGWACVLSAVRAEALEQVLGLVLVWPHLEDGNGTGPSALLCLVWIHYGERVCTMVTGLRWKCTWSVVGQWT